MQSKRSSAASSFELLHERLFRDAVDPILIEDLEGRIVDVNTAASAFYGWSRDELAGQPFAMLVPHERLSRERELRRECAAGAKLRDVETLRITKDGRIGAVSASLSLLTDAGGRPVAIAVIERPADRATSTASSGDRGRATSTASSDGRDRALRASAAAALYGVFDVDLVGHSVYWSPEMHAILGLPDATVANLGVEDVPDHVHVDDRKRVAAVIRKSHDPAGDGTFETEHRVLRPNGEVRWVLVKGKTLFEGQGASRRPVRATGLVVDVTDRKNSEEARIRALIDVSAQMVWTTDAHGRVVEDSPSWRAFTGRSYEELRRRGWDDAVHPDDRERVRATWAEAFESSAPIEDEFRLRHASGAWRWVRSRALPLLNEDGSVRSWVGMNADITDRKEAELEAARSHEREREANALLDAIFAAAPIGLGFWDLSLRFQRINAGLAEMHGLPVEAHIGRRLDELLPDIEQSEELYLKWREILATGEPWLGVEVRGETPARPGQQRVWREDFFPVRVRGEIVGLAAVVQEITERRLAEAQLRESEARFRQMADNAPFMVWVTSPDGACTFLSRTWYEFTGQSAATALGWGWLEALHPNDREAHRRAFRAAQDRLEPLQSELRLRRQDGEYRWVINAAAPRFGPGNKFKGYIGSIIDISERKLAEQALESADRRKDQFLAMLAHELRNPLAPMTTAMELMRRLLPADPKLDELRRMIERQLEHLTRLVDDLLDTSRISTGKIVLRTERVDLHGVVRHSLETSEPLIRSRGHRVVSSEPDEPMWVDGDPVRLAQIVTNLLNNAAKFTAPGGRIEIDVRRDGREAVITVRDNGAGIASDVLPHLFDRFMRVDEQPGSEGSMGIGLSLAKRLVELHGGSVEAHSQGLGRGSEFVVRLPLADGAPAEAGLPHGARETASKRILVVDDNEDAAHTLTLLLEHSGHVVRQAQDARAALDIAREFEPQVVLLDIGLPDMDGWELARALRDQHGGKDLTLIAISGYGQSEDRRRSLASGIDRHLTKPVDYAEISKWI